MPLITKIIPQRKRGRFNIYIDGNYAFSLSEETLLEKNIVVDKKLSDSEISNILYEDIYLRYFNKIINFLSYRLRSKAEIYRRIDKYVAKDKIKGNIDTNKLKGDIMKKLESMRLVNDEQFSEVFVRDKTKSKKPVGKIYIINELRKKGISEDIINKHICTYGSQDEYLNALKLAGNKLVTMKDSEISKKKSKLIRYLRARGFSMETIYAVVDTKFNVP